MPLLLTTPLLPPSAINLGTHLSLTSQAPTMSTPLEAFKKWWRGESCEATALELLCQVTGCVELAKMVEVAVAECGGGEHCFNLLIPENIRMNFVTSLCRRLNLNELVINAPVYSSASGRCRHWLHMFDTTEEAARAYDSAAEGSKVRTNFEIAPVVPKFSPETSSRLGRIRRKQQSYKEEGKWELRKWWWLRRQRWRSQVWR
ncbi:hypothetical protein C3L33_14511, partial [Rhododendron williamsianum]